MTQRYAMSYENDEFGQPQLVLNLVSNNAQVPLASFRDKQVADTITEVLNLHEVLTSALNRVKKSLNAGTPTKSRQIIDEALAQLEAK